jgi:glycosyltransferase involved in cell wall biosynthesis
VSVIVPCRNEERFIGSCLDSIVGNDYPKDRLEVLVVDGGSEDGTRAIVEKYCRIYPFIRLLDNPRKTIPAAMNIGIINAHGEVIMKVDAHSRYPMDYISKCVRYLYEYAADNVGGLCRTLPRKNTIFGRAVALSLSHPFGIGNSRFRIGCDRPIWAETAYGGCYKREVFDKVGLYDERIEYSEDITFNSRLRRAGGRVLLVPEIEIEYFARSDPWSFWKHNWRNGIWAIMPILYSDHVPVRARHLAPLSFVAALSGSAVLGIWLPPLRIVTLGLLIAYALANIVASVETAWRAGDARLVLVMPVAFGMLHFGYGFGSLWAVGKAMLSGLFWGKLRGAFRRGGLPDRQ